MSSMGFTNDGGAQKATPTNTWVRVAGVVVRSGYPATNLVGNTLVMDAPSTGNLRWSGNFTAGLGTQQFRVVKNGSTVVGAAVNKGVIGTAAGISVLPGDTLELQAFASVAGYDDISPNAATFLEYNQTTSQQPIGAAVPVVWGTAAALGVETGLVTTRPVTWATGASLGVDQSVAASRPVDWGLSADLYKGQTFELAPSRPITWGLSAGLTQITPAQNLNPDFDSISVSVETADGRMLGGFSCEMINSITWGYELSEVTSCDISLVTTGDPEMIKDLRQWLHWVTVWHADRPMWRGPLLKIDIGRGDTKLSARDTAVFYKRTRSPTTKTWTDSDPTGIAESLILAMNDVHGIASTPVVLPSVTESFTYHADADSRMLDQVMDDLVKLGLRWTTVAGRIYLGRFDPAPFAELAECDFLAEIRRVRDGTDLFNDVRLQGQNFAQTVVVPVGDLRLQTLVSLDDVYGVSNIQKAAQLYAQETAAFRDTLVVPSGASLHPEAPILLHDMIPGRRIRVSVDELSTVMEIDRVQFSITPTSYDTQVSLSNVPVQTEIGRLTGSGL